ncbi:MAG: hypothetical protein R3B54_15385 [Bdellovibrionota bacterium]
MGYGCNSLETRLGAGIKRTGTNQVYRVTDYIEIVTLSTSRRAAAPCSARRTGQVALWGFWRTDAA